MSGEISTDKQTMEMKYVARMNKQHADIAETPNSHLDRIKIIALAHLDETTVKPTKIFKMLL